MLGERIKFKRTESKGFLTYSDAFKYQKEEMKKPDSQSSKIKKVYNIHTKGWEYEVEVIYE